jgi:oxygen-independent coproporphyrinogen-3 oxidase
MFDSPPVIPLSLYVHLPWCVKKCPYCDFNSHQVGDTIPEQSYVEALLRDLEQDLPAIWGRRIHSVFIGGGTPSLFSGQAIQQLLSGLRARLAITPLIEISLEANPGTVDEAHFAAYRQAGVNRLSIGVQSFDSAQLTRIGRIHDAQQAHRAVAVARQSGFDNLNIDLMFGQPGQTQSAALADLETAIQLGAEHISWYQFTIEPNTAFAHQPPVLPDDDERYELQEQGQALLAVHGYQQYEVSAYARPGKRCDHNLNYWQFGDYLGIGAGAHGKITEPQAGRITRSVRKRHPKDYLQQAGQPTAVERRELAAADQIRFEFMLNALRLREGFEFELFEQRTRLSRELLTTILAQAEKKKLLECTATGVRHSELGWSFLNDTLCLFLPEHDQGERVVP